MRLVPLLTLLAACGSDHGVTGLCATPDLAFDIEEASVLQDAQGYPDMHDAVILSYDTSALPEGARWRVKSVDIMPMIAEFDYDWFMDGQQVTVEVWDAAEPNGTPWKVTRTFHKDDHTWEPVTLPAAATAFDPNQLQAWWEFDFADVIPTTGMTGPDYLVGVAWDASGGPTLGYSNFTRSCALNWTDYADGRGWVLNGDTSGDECSWPMLRVGVEILEERVECEGDSVAL